MNLRGKVVRLTKDIMWFDEKSGLRLSIWSGDGSGIVPEDEDVDISSVEQAVQLGILSVRGDTVSTRKTKPRKKVTEVTGEPIDLLKFKTAHITKNILPKLGIEQLSIMLDLEAAGRNRTGKPRKTLMNAIMNQLKKKGANETVVYDSNDEPIYNRQYDQERQFPGEPSDQKIHRREAHMKPE